MDGFMETGGGLDAAFEAALLGEEEPQEDAELNEEPGNPQEPEGQSPGGALPVGLYPYSPEGNKTRVATILAQPYGRRP